MLLNKPLLLALAAACAAPALHARTWRKLVNPRFTVLTEISDGETRDIAADFDDYLLVIQKLVPAATSELPRLTIVLFDRDRELDPYKPLSSDGRIADQTAQSWDVMVDAVSSRGYGWDVIAVSTENYFRQVRGETLRMGTDWYLTGLGFSVPAALSHGTAEVLGTYQRQLTHGVLGTPIGSYAHLVGNYPLIPLNQLLAPGSSDQAVDQGNSALYDAECWAFVHYLMFAPEPMRRHAFAAYWRAIHDRVAPMEALQQVLGPDLAAHIDLQLRDYLHGTHYGAQISVGPKLENHDPIVPAADPEVQLTLARALVGFRTGEAMARAEAAIAAGAGPEAYALRAELMERMPARGREKREAVETALARGAKNAYLLSIEARIQLDGAPQAGSQGSPEARAAANLAEKAANLDMGLEQAFDCAAMCLPHADHVTAADVQFMDYARARFPLDRYILVGQSELRRRRGDVAGAQRLLDQAVSDDPGLSVAQRPAVAAFLQELEKDRKAQPGS